MRGHRTVRQRPRAYGRKRLPLGLVGQSEYSETSFQLSFQEQLTLVTDGVVEARNKSGELFGFERTQSISTKSAELIALAAQDFGQDDDITVLTLTRVPVGELAAPLSPPSLSPAHS
jgi:serine phosphatase RsbU (regulator of sigma subunit)